MGEKVHWVLFWQAKWEKCDSSSFIKRISSCSPPSFKHKTCPFMLFSLFFPALKNSNCLLLFYIYSFLSYLLNNDQNKFYKAAKWQIVVITINRFRTRDKKPTFTADVALNFSKFVSILCSRTSLMSSIRDLT